MNIILGILVFCVILFLYIHVNYHITTSNIMEIYNVDRPTQIKLEEICRLKQPVKFTFDKIDLFDKINIKNLTQKNANQGINIRSNHIDGDKLLHNMLSLTDASNLMKNNKDCFCENNETLLKDMGLLDEIKEKTEFFKPPMCCSDKYDYITGGKDCHTPLRYNIDYRSFYLVTSGDIKVKLINPDSTDVLDVHRDYFNLEFLSSFNPWDPTKPRKTESLEATLNEGDVCFVPPYWFYSFEFGENVSIIEIKYNTYVSEIVNLKDYVLQFLQKQNTTFKM